MSSGAIFGHASLPDRVGPGDEPERIGRFELLLEIGLGGMGEIFLAKDCSHATRPVALKVLNEAAAREEQIVGMFIDEASIMAQIHHPNVLEILGFGREDGRYYIAMEYLQGRPLAQVMAAVFEHEQRLSPTAAASIAALAARGLHAAHLAVGRDGHPLEIVHRDVSPQNIFITHDGVAKVIDFGIARANDRITRTSAGLFKGKAAYLSPEQVEQKPIDARSDVFALGVCLWEMIAGRRLFFRPSQFDTLVAVREGPVPPPSQVAGVEASELDAIVLRAVERDRDRRTQSAAVLEAELLSFLAERSPRVELVDLMQRRFGPEARQESDLITRIFERSARAEDSQRLRTLSGFGTSPAHESDPQARVITFAGRPEDAAALDRFRAASPPPRVRAHSLHSAIKALEEEFRIAEKRRASSVVAPPRPAASEVPRRVNRLPIALLASAILIVALLAAFVGLRRHFQPIEANPLDSPPATLGVSRAR